MVDHLNFVCIIPVLYRIIYLSKLEIINETCLTEKGLKKKIQKVISN